MSERLQEPKTHAPFAHVDKLCTLAVNIEGLEPTRQLKHYAIKGCSHPRGGDRDTLRVG